MAGAAKGDVLGVARIAAIQAAKRTADLIPLCHPLALTRVAVEFDVDHELRSAVECRATAETFGRTGVEMEALTAVTVGLLTIYDMCKAVDRGMRFGARTFAGKERRALRALGCAGAASSRRNRGLSVRRAGVARAATSSTKLVTIRTGSQLALVPLPALAGCLRVLAAVARMRRTRPRRPANSSLMMSTRATAWPVIRSRAIPAR